MIAGTGCSPDGFSSDDGVERQDMIATNVKECPEISRAVCDGAIQRLYIIKSKTRDDSFEFFGGWECVFWQFQDFGAALAQGATCSISRNPHSCHSICPFPSYLDLDKAQWQNDNRYEWKCHLPMKVDARAAIAPWVSYCSSP